jgi:uncharacterized RDD family membrane protein YckC
MSDEIPALKRGGFWRRAVALMIDTLIVSAIVVAVGIPLSLLTDGRVRVGNAILNKTECFEIARSYPEIRLPQDFKPTSGARCVRSLLGHSFDWFLFVEQKSVSGIVTYKKDLTFPLDPNGDLASPFYLDNLSLMLVLISLFVQEYKFGETSGKYSMSLRVQSLGGGRPSRKQAAIRLLRFSYLAPIGFALLEQMAGFDLSYIFYTLGLSGTLTIIIIGEFIWRIRHGELPFYDRWAGTDVLLVGHDAIAKPSPDSFSTSS